MVGDIKSESPGDFMSESVGDFVGIGSERTRNQRPACNHLVSV